MDVFFYFIFYLKTVLYALLFLLFVIITKQNNVVTNFSLGISASKITPTVQANYLAMKYILQHSRPFVSNDGSVLGEYCGADGSKVILSSQSRRTAFQLYELACFY